MMKFETTKKIANITVGYGTGAIVGQVIRSNTNPRNVVDHVSIFAASMVMGQMLADKTQAYTDEKMDDLHRWYNTNIKKTA